MDGPSPDEFADATRLDLPDERDEPKRIGPYRLLHRLGEGGMGVVYEAWQERPVRRRVALKVIKRGMDSRQVVLRFESERQALALMSHPNIAGVFDAGVTEDGRPYFAMECVRGVPMTHYCDRKRLSLEARLRLFVKVCNGVQHAHQKGVIHRDLKPSNVLVCDEDGAVVPKIIDFGVAKATAHRLTEHTLYTELGQLVGTPEYMSPEQAELSGVDIDTRTDVYQLGLLLYELLTGRLPFDSTDLRRVGFDKFRQRVLEEEPLRPSICSTREHGDGDRPDPERAADAAAFSRQLRGDLDWIVLKALDKDRTRRYASASEFAADVERYLKHEPVVASPRGNLYRLRKFVVRHRAGVAFGTALIALLATLAVTMSVAVVQVARARDEATREAETANRVAAFLERLFKGSEPERARGREVSAREVLDRAVNQIHEDDTLDELLRGRLMSVMGDVYASHGSSAEARSLLEAALEHQLRALPDDDLAVAETHDRLGGLLATDFSEFGAARRHYRRALEIRRQRLGATDPDVALTMNRLANVLIVEGEFEAARGLYDEAFAILERDGPPDDLDFALALNQRAALLKRDGEHLAALPLLEQSLEIRSRHHGDDHPDVARTRHKLGEILGVLGRWSQARLNLERALEVRSRIYGAEHPRAAETIHALAVLAAREGRIDEAHRLHDTALAIFDRHGSLENSFLLYNEARFAALVGDRERAFELLRQAFVGRRFALEDPLRDGDFRPYRDDPEFRSMIGEAARGR